MSEPVFVRLTSLPQAIDALEREARREGFTMVTRLRDEWMNGANRFDGEGEALFGAFRQGRLIGIAGLNRDPYADDPGVGRVRHVYVLAGERGSGIGRTLVEQVIAHARGRFRIVRLVTRRASSFYDKLGFARAEGGDATHCMTL